MERCFEKIRSAPIGASNSFNSLNIYLRYFRRPTPVQSPHFPQQPLQSLDLSRRIIFKSDGIFLAWEKWRDRKVDRQREADRVRWSLHAIFIERDMYILLATAALGPKPFLAIVFGPNPFPAAALGPKSFPNAALGQKPFTASALGPKPFPAAALGPMSFP